MADALVERRPSARFFCHRCNVEFEDVLQDYRCPYCASGFIEQLESEAESSALSGDDFSDADMSNLDDSDDLAQSNSHPMLSDLAFLMSGGRPRYRHQKSVKGAADVPCACRHLDATVRMLHCALLGQLENAGPPPLPREQIAAIPSEALTPEQAAANTSCSVCWENFQIGEMVSRLQCDHIFHSTCIEPWLQLHATCPICRRSLLAEDAPSESTSEDGASQPPRPPSATPSGSLPQVRLRRLARRRAGAGAGWTRGAEAEAEAEAEARWPTDSSDTSSLNSADRQEYNMDIDFD
ncbi:hypothetical protein MSG28_012484 [Choristoneura fumiferana]|uniref:Uncharacterized protein n=1 Tax=Choristoneura fumiferana TaxID=7141 RepID=A0ACC0KE24_CHOFU|nr:hypothetical protein MSG28_012484 [Choristoneura fumiferana]